MSSDRFFLTEVPTISTSKRRALVDRVGMWSDVLLIIRNKRGELMHESFQNNLRTNAGADFWNAQLFGTAAAGTQANWIALTADATAAAAADTTLTSEITTNGLARAQATVTHTAGAASTQLQHTWTYTGATSVVIAKVGAFTAATVGTMALETLLTSTGTVSANGDTIQVTWTVNY